MARLQRLFLIRDYTIIFHSKTKKNVDWLLVNVFFWRKKHTYTREREMDSNTKAYHNSTQKPWCCWPMLKIKNGSIAKHDCLVTYQIQAWKQQHLT